MRITFEAAAAAAAIGLASMLLLGPAAAQDTVRVRGTIEKVDGDMLQIKSRDGTDLKVKLAPNPGVSATVKATMADIKPGSYIGVGALAQPDGSMRAISV